MESNTPGARQALFEHIRIILINQLRISEPSVSSADITRERAALEAAIRKVETAAGAAAGTPTGPARTGPPSSYHGEGPLHIPGHHPALNTWPRDPSATAKDRNPAAGLRKKANSIATLDGVIPFEQRPGAIDAVREEASTTPPYQLRFRREPASVQSETVPSRATAKNRQVKPEAATPPPARLVAKHPPDTASPNAPAAELIDDRTAAANDRTPANTARNEPNAGAPVVINQNARNLFRTSLIVAENKRGNNAIPPKTGDYATTANAPSHAPTTPVKNALSGRAADAAIVDQIPGANKQLNRPTLPVGDGGAAAAARDQPPAKNTIRPPAVAAAGNPDNNVTAAAVNDHIATANELPHANMTDTAGRKSGGRSTGGSSTIILDGLLGIQLLDRLILEAAHPLAPDNLVQDARTVLDWLGVNKSAAIKAKHYDLFGRAIKRYMTEDLSSSGATDPTGQLSDPALTGEVREVFNRLLDREQSAMILDDALTWFAKIWVRVIFGLNLVAVVGSFVIAPTLLGGIVDVLEIYSPLNAWTWLVEAVALSPALAAIAWRERRLKGSWHAVLQTIKSQLSDRSTGQDNSGPLRHIIKLRTKTPRPYGGDRKFAPITRAR